MTELPDLNGAETRRSDGSTAPRVRQRGATIEPNPSSRRLVTSAVRAGRRIVRMHGLIDIDRTAALDLLAEHEPPLSVTAFFVASVGRAAASFPQVHAYRDWRGRLVRHRHVDVQTLIEVSTGQGPVRVGSRRAGRRRPQCRLDQREDTMSVDPLNVVFGTGQVSRAVANLLAGASTAAWVSGPLVRPMTPLWEPGKHSKALRLPPM